MVVYERFLVILWTEILFLQDEMHEYLLKRISVPVCPVCLFALGVRHILDPFVFTNTPFNNEPLELFYQLSTTQET